MKNSKNLSKEQLAELLSILQSRFEKNMARHEGMNWKQVAARLDAHKDRLWSLWEMERTGGEPDIVIFDEVSDEYFFYDCSPESPKGRRSLCYDRKALEARKENQPAGNAIDMAAGMGIQILDEEQYRRLQQAGAFDTKTSSWVKTPEAIR